MDETTIRGYAKIMQDLDLSAFELSENGKTLRLERNSTPTSASTTLPVVLPAVAPSPSPEHLMPVTQSPDVVTVTSPMVGMFYAAPAENQACFVSVGDSVKQGDVLCIIESMKLMNEITADCDGVITEVCVGNQQVVDFGHPLFRLRKESV